MESGDRKRYGSLLFRYGVSHTGKLEASSSVARDVLTFMRKSLGDHLTMHACAAVVRKNRTHLAQSSGSAIRDYAVRLLPSCDVGPFGVHVAAEWKTERIVHILTTISI